jgi:hypothetical protein
MTKGRNFSIALTFTFLLYTFFAVAQNAKPPRLPIDEQTKLVTYKAIVDVPAAGFKELQKRAFIWANQYYKNPSDVIRERDTVAGKMVCKARLKIMTEPDKKGVTTEAGLIEYTLKLEFKENKYRYTVSDINWKQKSYFPIERWMDTTAPGYKSGYEYYLQQTDEMMKSLVKDLDKGMKLPSPKAKKDEW